MNTIETEYAIGQVVYLIIDQKVVGKAIQGITVDRNGFVRYQFENGVTRNNKECYDTLEEANKKVGAATENEIKVLLQTINLRLRRQAEGRVSSWSEIREMVRAIDRLAEITPIGKRYEIVEAKRNGD